MNQHVIAVVGMTNAGKTEFSKLIQEKGFSYFRMGDITEEKIREEGLVNNEENNKMMRGRLRQEYGQGAYATLNMPKIMALLEKGPVVIDGLYSWGEYKIFKKEMPEMKTVAVYAPPEVRYKRAESREGRNMKNFHEGHPVKERDYVEIEKSDKGGPIAMADYTIMNHLEKEQLDQEFEKFWRWITDGKET